MSSDDICHQIPDNYSVREHSMYGLHQWETTLHYNVIFQWLSPYQEWSLFSHILQTSYKNTSKHFIWWSLLPLQYSRQLEKKYEAFCMKSTRYDIKSNVWLTMNYDFGSWVKQFANDCQEGCSHKRTSLANHFMNGQKSVLTVSHTSFNSSQAISCVDHKNTMKINIDDSLHPCHQAWLIPIQHLGTIHKHVAQAHGAKLIFTSWYWWVNARKT